MLTVFILIIFSRCTVFCTTQTFGLNCTFFFLSCIVNLYDFAYEINDQQIYAMRFCFKRANVISNLVRASVLRFRILQSSHMFASPLAAAQVFDGVDFHRFDFLHFVFACVEDLAQFDFDHFDFIWLYVSRLFHDHFFLLR